jgi:hypothetical protein
MMYGIMFTLGYFVYDLVYLINVIWDQDGFETTKAMFFHHGAAIIGMLGALGGGYSMIGLCAAGSLCEISTVFLNFRLAYYYAKKDEKTFR